MGLIVPDCPEHCSQGARYLGAGLGVGRCHRGLVLAGMVATVALGARAWGIVTELSVVKAATGELLVVYAGAVGSRAA